MHTHAHANLCTNVSTYIHTSLEMLGDAGEGNRRAHTHLHIHININTYTCTYTLNYTDTCT